MKIISRSGCSVVLCSVALASLSHAITLDAALARTLRNNPEIRAAKSRLEEAAGRRLVLRARGLPHIGVNVPLGVQGGHRSGERSVQPFAFAQGAFIQPLFNAAVPASFRRGDLELLLAQQRLNVAILEQLHGARLAFYAAAFNDSLRALAEAQHARLQTNTRAQSDRYQAGKADRNAVTRALVLEQELTPRVEESRRASSGALLQLAQAMGDELGRAAGLKVEEDLAYAPFQIDVAAESSAAIRERADLKLARLLVRAAREDERIAQAGYYPQIDATVSGTYIPVTDIRQGSEGSARRSDDIVSSEARGGIAYTWRVIDNGRVAGAVMRERAARETNAVVLARLEADVPRALLRIQNNLRGLQSRYDALNRASGVADQTVQTIQNNLAQGLSSQLEYRTAENSSLETKAGLLAVGYEEKVARAEADRITGRYFQFSEDTAAKVH